MYTLRINEGKVALVFSKGDYKYMLEAGTHFVSPFKRVMIYDLTARFNAPIALELLLKDQKLKSRLEVIDVADNEIVIRYENGNFQEVLRAGRHCYFKGLVERSFTTVDLNKSKFPEQIDKKVLGHIAMLPFVRLVEVSAHENGLLMVAGEMKEVLGPGTYYFVKNSTQIEVVTADLRQLQMEVNGQEILSRDKAALRLNFNLQYRISDIRKALLDNKDHAKQLYVLVQLALREFVSAVSLDELLSNKDAVADHVRGSIQEKAAALGLEVAACGIKDVILPGEMKEIMNYVLVAQKQAEANTIVRREETASTRSLLNTAKMMEDNQMLFKLKEMEYMERVAAKVNEITISGGEQVLGQLRTMFTANKSP